MREQIKNLSIPALQRSKEKVDYLNLKNNTLPLSNVFKFMFLILKRLLKFSLILKFKCFLKITTIIVFTNILVKVMTLFSFVWTGHLSS